MSKRALDTMHAWGVGEWTSPSSAIFRVISNLVLQQSFLLKHFIILRNKAFSPLCLLSCLPFFLTREATPAWNVLRGFPTLEPFPVHASGRSWEPLSDLGPATSWADESSSSSPKMGTRGFFCTPEGFCEPWGGLQGLLRLD